MPLVLLSYSVNTQALSATTAKEIIGSNPYLTFDKGITKINTSEGLLSITISDGKTKTTYTPSNNPSTEAKPIELPTEGQSFEDIGILVPSDTTRIKLSDLIGPPYNYWGDDDGDGKGTNGVTATGDLAVSIVSSITSEVVSRDEVLTSCRSPYIVFLVSSNGSLTTRYGIPNSISFTGGRVTYYIIPKKSIYNSICFIKPNTDGGFRPYAGPENIWRPNKGFLLQSTAPSTYGRNFPTTGANNLFFDLNVGSDLATSLTWPKVTKGGITATMTVKEDYPSNLLRVTLTGPAATEAQKSSASPSKVAIPTLPQTFEIVGYDSSNRPATKYGFVLKQWFVSRGGKQVGTIEEVSSWCSGIGYRVPQVKDLTNAVGNPSNSWPVATPSSSGNNYQRNIGAGFLAEWGPVGTYGYPNAGIPNLAAFWTSNKYRTQNALSDSYRGVDASMGSVSYGSQVICVYP